MKEGYEGKRREDMGKPEPKTSSCCYCNDSNVHNGGDSPRLGQLRRIAHAMRPCRSLNENIMLPQYDIAFTPVNCVRWLGLAPGTLIPESLAAILEMIGLSFLNRA
jgi:hypothetical protein